MSKDLGINLGSSTITVYKKETGIVMDEPSIVALDRATGKALYFGRDAQTMLQHTPGGLRADWPLTGGLLQNPEMTRDILRYIYRQCCGKSKPNVLLASSGDLSHEGERTLSLLAREAGARKVFLVDESISAAFGAGLNIARASASMIVNIGAGSMKAAVFGGNRVLFQQSDSMGSAALDRALEDYVRKTFRVRITSEEARRLKNSVESIQKTAAKKETLSGISLTTGLPVNVELPMNEILQALRLPLTQLIHGIGAMLEKMPVEVRQQIGENGMVLTGGGNLFYGMASMVTRVTGIPARVAEKAADCTAIGIGCLLAQLDSAPNEWIRCAEGERKV